MDMVHINGLMVECILDSGRGIKCMAMVKSSGQIRESIQGYFFWILIFKEYFEDKKHGRGQFEWGDGRKYEGIWVNGICHNNFQVNNKEQVFIIWQQVKKNMANGKMVLKKDGQNQKKQKNI